MTKQDNRELSGDVVSCPDKLGWEVRLFGVTRREAGGYLAGAVLLAVLLTAAGAFDSDELGLWHRTALWLVVSVLAVSQALVLDGLIAPRLPADQWGRVLAVALAVLGVIVLMTIELHLLKFTPFLPYEFDPLGEFFIFLTAPIGAVAGVVVLSRIIAPYGLRPHHAPARVATSPPSESGQPHAGHAPASSAVANWPRELVLRVRADDHYLEVFTASGRRFLRGRMKDALQALADADGVQPHRSWWVARSEIAGARRQGRDYLIETHDGAVIPVARSRVDDLRRMSLL